MASEDCSSSTMTLTKQLLSPLLHVYPHLKTKTLLQNLSQWQNHCVWINLFLQHHQSRVLRRKKTLVSVCEIHTGFAGILLQSILCQKRGKEFSFTHTHVKQTCNDDVYVCGRTKISNDPFMRHCVLR